VGSSLQGNLAMPGAAGYYTFQGSKGEGLVIYTAAQNPAGASFDPTWIDTVVTLFDMSGQQIAENNDWIQGFSQDSALDTLLPADGTYCVRVEDCWTWAQNPSSTCLGTADKAHTTYTVGINQLDPMALGTVEDAEAAGNAPTPLTFAKASSGKYYLTEIYGTFDSATDVDAFSFTVPADAVTLPPGTRGEIEFYVAPAGTSGDGSTTPAGNVYLTDPSAADPTQRVAELYGPNYTGETPTLAVQADVTKPYVFWVEHPSTAASTNDFYFVLQGGGTSNPLETNDAANDTVAGAEMPMDQPDKSGGHHYYIAGDISTDTDVDDWEVPVGTATQIAVSCGAQRNGSGLRGFKAEALDPATMSSVTMIVENATSDADTGYQPIPSGVQSIVVSLSTTMPHDPNVTSSY